MKDLFVLKHRDTLGWCVEVDGHSLTNYTQIKGVAEFWKSKLVEKYEKLEECWEEQIIKASKEQTRIENWIKELNKKYNVNKVVDKKVIHYNKQQAVQAAMAAMANM